LFDWANIAGRASEMQMSGAIADPAHSR